MICVIMLNIIIIISTTIVTTNLFIYFYAG